MIPEASLEQTGHGVAPRGQGWFVVNAREARWRRRPGRGHSLPLTGWSDEEREALFRQLGVAIYVLEPGEPIGMYHWEQDAEEFVVLAGAPLLIVEGQERPLRPWDVVHCPPGTRHIIVGAGSGRSVVLAAGAREHGDEHCNGGGYVVDEVARRHGASPDEDTNEAAIAYARYGDAEPARYEDGWLP